MFLQTIIHVMPPNTTYNIAANMKLKNAFTWKKTSSSEIEINTNGETQTLEINNGLLIENGAFGTTVFKKQ